MAIITEEITLDISHPQQWVRIRLQQNDANEKQIDVNITDDGDTYNIPTSGATVVLEMMKQDNKPIYNTCNIVNNKARFLITEQMTASSGMGFARISITDSSTGGEISTVKFYVYVDEEVINESIIVSSGEFTALKDALSQLTYYQARFAQIGDLSLLQTESNTDLVGAMNEVHSISISNTEKIGFLEQLKLKFAYGAVGDGVADDGVAIRNAIEDLKASGGGKLYLFGKHKVSPVDINHACLFIDFDNIEICGNIGSELIVTNNAHVPIHISPEADLRVIPSASGYKNIKIHDIGIRGTGIYENFALAKGRGILIRNCADVEIYGCHIDGMSMIGICSEHGFGKFNVHDNVLNNCKYSSINYNGRCYQSLIKDNIISGVGGNTDAVHIQVTGGCIVKGNQIFGDSTHPELIGGIMYGEGNYHGVSEISSNTVTHCRYGLKAIYHGNCKISDNTFINCVTTSGIIIINGTASGFTVPSNDNLISNNHCISCAPYGIDCSSDNNLLLGNKIINIVDPVNPSGVGEPDYIANCTTQIGIHINGSNNSLIGNQVSGCGAGWSSQINKEMGAISGNNFKGNTAIYRLESTLTGATGQYASPVTTMPERSSNGVNWTETLLTDAQPSNTWCPSSSQWRHSNPSVGQPIGGVVTSVSKTTTSAQANAGATTVTLTNPSGWSVDETLTVVGFELDNGQWHWTKVTGLSGSTATIASAVPTGRTINSGSLAYFNLWRNLAVLA